MFNFSSHWKGIRISCWVGLQEKFKGASQEGDHENQCFIQMFLCFCRHEFTLSNVEATRHLICQLFLSFKSGILMEIKFCPEIKPTNSDLVCCCSPFYSGFLLILNISLSILSPSWFQNIVLELLLECYYNVCVGCRVRRECSGFLGKFLLVAHWQTYCASMHTCICNIHVYTEIFNLQ